MTASGEPQMEREEREERMPMTASCVSLGESVRRRRCWNRPEMKGEEST